MFSHIKGSQGTESHQRDLGDPLMKYVCEYCRQIFSSLHSLVIHRHHDHEPGKAINCLYCSESFQTCKSWHSHLRSHVQQPPCKVCSKMCKKLCKQDNEKSHAQEEPHICGECDRGCYRDYQLGKEGSSVGKRLFECKYCGKKYTQKTYVAIHCQAQHPEFLKDHVPFLCPTCGKSFAYKRSLTLHEVSHMGPGGRQFLCDICGKAVSTRDSLSRHRRTHTGEKPYDCGVCAKAFSRRTYLRTHLRTHTGEKPYACEHCGKTFTQRSPLIIHERHHTGQKPYKCAICQKAYVSKNLLKTHHRSHHVQVP